MNIYKAGDKQRSGPHRRVEGILDELGISYMSEEPFPPYTVDILMPEFWLGIEIDGPGHSKAKDKIRDNFILEYFNLPILRINAKVWIQKENIKEDVVNFIEQFYEDADKRKREAHARR